MPDNARVMLQEALGGDIDISDLFKRLRRHREEASNPHHGIGKGSLDLNRRYDGVEIPSVKPSLGQKAENWFKKISGAVATNSGSGSSHGMGGYGMGGSGGYGKPITEKDLPPIPSGIADDDMIGLAIYYHEAGMLDVSAYYLEKSSKMGHPLGCYLRAMALRHGWGIPEDKVEAFKCFTEAAEYAMLTIPQVAARRRADGGANANIQRGKSVSSRRPTSLRSLQSFSSVAQLLPEDLEMAISLLPLPLYEIAVCFQQGWGVSKNPGNAVYYLTIASRLGDADAMYELGYCYLNGNGIAEKDVKANKMEAAKYLRAADEHGKKVVGESWVWKKKWGGDQE
ncbi:hypothetical protein HDU76_006254 [Blyttiomyces sp. JEL0837]|nr:hypothetical protein HDU76_006254 [Blyttiomyces sp. JEL0837]